MNGGNGPYLIINDNPTDANYANLMESRDVYFTLYPPKQWGDLKVVFDRQDTVKVVDGNDHFCRFSVGFPPDDQPHDITFCWPDVKLEKTFSYTAYGKALVNQYRFDVRINGHNAYRVDEFELNYTTHEGSRKTAVVKGERTDYGHYRLFLDESETIDTLSVTDHVAEGDDHAVITPTTVHDPVRLSAQSRMMLVSDFRSANYQTNTLTLNTINEMGLRFVDAVTGHPVTQDVTVKAFYNATTDAQTYSEFADDGAIHTPLYHGFEICAEGYTPRLLRDITFNNRNIVIDGEKSFMSNGKIVCTVALCPKGSGFVDIIDVATNETAPDGNGVWPNHRWYTGADMLVPYDGSLKPGRQIRVVVGTANPPEYLYITSPSANGKKIKLWWRTDSWNEHELWLPGNLSQRYFEYRGELREFLYSEVEGATLLTTDDNRSMAFLRMKNIDKDPMELVKDMTLAPVLPTSQVGQVSGGIKLGRMQKQFDNFELQLPSTLPFTVVVKKENSDYLFRALYSQNFLPDNASVLLSDIDAFAQPMWLFGGTDLAYIRPATSAGSKPQVQLQSGAALSGMDDYNVFDLDVFSRTVSGGAQGIMACTASSSGAASSPEQVSNNTRVYVSTGDGSSWQTPVGLGDYGVANLMPKATLSATGRAAVVWKSGTFVSAGAADDPTAGHLDGDLLVAFNEGQGWSDQPQTMMALSARRQIADYSLAMADSIPMVVGTVIDSLPDGNVRSRLTALTLSDQRLPLEMPTTIEATQPQVVTLGNGYYVGALATSANGQADVQLLRLTSRGEFTDAGMLGLDSRGLIDFKLIAPQSASGLDGLAVVWKEAQREYTDYENDVFTMKTAVYGARISQSPEGTVYLSCPQKLLSQDDNLVVTYYDAVFADNKLTAAIAVADDETEGATVLESSVTFENALKCEYAGLANTVEEGKDAVLGFVVMNEGYEAIDYVDIDVNGKVTTVKVNLMPGHSTEVTATAPADTDLDQPIDFNITPYFAASPLAARSLAQARARAARMPAVVRRMADTRSGMGQLQVRVSDVAVRTLSTARAADGSNTVVVAVDNLSPVTLADGWQVRAGLFRDAAGTQLVADNCVATLPVSALRDADGNNTTTVSFAVSDVETTTTLYVVAHTVDADGRVVSDQNLSDNMAPVPVFVSGVPSSVAKNTVETTARFTVRNTDSGILASGVKPGDNLRVYTPLGQLVNWTEAQQTDTELKVPGHGVYIVTNGRQNETIRH